MQKAILCFFIFCCLTISCSKESVNTKPNLIVDYELIGLRLKLSIKAADEDGKVEVVNIDWGDSKSENLYPGTDGLVEQSHYYLDPLTTTIVVTATDNEKNTFVKTLNLSPEYLPTSFEGIKQGLYKTSANELLVLTINMHNYQEKFQNEKFNMLTDIIGQMDIDFVCMQECAQHRNSTIYSGIIRIDNMALIISERLKKKYNKQYSFIWDWSHYGWDVWEEGDAILSPHSLIASDSRYVSTNTQTTGILSRKTIFGAYITQTVDTLNIFSTHLHWRLSETDQEQNLQISNLKSMVAEKAQLSNNQNTISIVAGDFNGTPTAPYPWSEGYTTMTANNSFIDSFLQIYTDANNKPQQNIYNTGGDIDGRIDYIFYKNNPNVEVIDSQIIFTPQVVGLISDHYGVITKFRIKKN